MIEGAEDILKKIARKKRNRGGDVMMILITGGAGLYRQPTCVQLLDSGYEIVRGR
jgi:hypothetical protein